MPRKKKYSLQEKAQILEVIKSLWESSEITYKQLEEVQKQKWKQVIYKAGTIRNKASKEKWSREAKKEESYQAKRKEVIEEVKPELVEEIIEHSNIIKALEGKYKPTFEKVRGSLMNAIEEEDLKKVKFTDTVFRVLSRARKTELEIMGILDVGDQSKVDIEILKLEILASKTESQLEVDKDNDDGFLEALGNSAKEDWGNNG